MSVHLILHLSDLSLHPIVAGRSVQYVTGIGTSFDAILNNETKTNSGISDNKIQEQKVLAYGM